MTQAKEDKLERLRKKAKERLEKVKLAQFEIPSEVSELVHELQVYQVELEIQNEELQEAQSTLEQSRQRYFRLFEEAPVGYVLLDKQAVIQEMNRSALKWFKLRQQSAKGRPFITVLNENKSAFFQFLRMLEITGQSQSDVFRLKRIDNTSFYARVYATQYAFSLDDGEKSESAYLLAIVDITELKKADEMMTFQAELLKAVQQSVIFTDAGGLVEYWNEYAETIYGYRKAEAIGMNICDLLCPPGAEEAAMVVIGEAVQNKKKWEGQLEVKRKSGALIWINIALSPVFNNDGELTGLVGISNDITKHKKMEEQLRQDSRLEATKVLAGGIAHDFNNLMVGVLGNAELLKFDEDFNDEQMQSLDAISISAQKAGDLAHKLLAYARGGKYNVRHVNLNQTIESLVTLNARSYHPKATIKTKLEGALDWVKADPTQMDQVFMNLLQNAYEAIEGQGAITVKSENVELQENEINDVPAGRYVQAQVIDQGKGIPEDILRRIFEPFFSTKFKGRGLGLAAVYGIVKNHEGFIFADNVPHEGTVFTVLFPSVAKAKAPLQESEACEKETLPEGKETILLIDDDDGVMKVTKKILERLGYFVIAASDGQKAIDAVEAFEGTIHLALLDVVMPGLSGTEVFQALQKLRPALPVILCSGYEKDNEVDTILGLGAKKFIQKPFRSVYLIKEMRTILDGDG